MAQLRDTVGLHDRHDPGTMIFDRARTDAEHLRYLLVGKTVGHQVHDFAFARGQRLVAAMDLCPDSTLVASPFVLPERIADALDQNLAGYGFLYEINGAGLDCPDRCRDVSVAGDKDDRNLAAVRIKNLLQVQSAHPLHPDIQDETSRVVSGDCRQEGFSRWERFDVQTLFAQCPDDGLAHPFVVVYDEDRWSPGP